MQRQADRPSASRSLITSAQPNATCRASCSCWSWPIPTAPVACRGCDPDGAAADRPAARSLSGDRAQHLHDYLANLGPDQLSAIRGLGTRLAIISEAHTGRYLAPAPANEIDLRRALRGEQVVLFSLNSSSYGKLSAQLGTLAVQDWSRAVGHRLQRPGGGPRWRRSRSTSSPRSALNNVISLLARGREAGVSVLVATQELADLDRAAPGLRDQVLGNTAFKLAHRQDVPIGTDDRADRRNREGLGADVRSEACSGPRAHTRQSAPGRAIHHRSQRNRLCPPATRC